MFIVSAKRTPIGRFQGGLFDQPATELGALLIRKILKETLLPVSEIEECIVGQVLTAGVGQAPARQTALKGGLEPSVRCTTVNKVCGSGLKAVMAGCDAIQLKQVQLIIAGGQESMSLAPHILQKSRQGLRLGDGTLKDSVIEDGLINPYDGRHMGVLGEMCAEKYGFTREDQDEFAKDSYRKALKAQSKGWFKKEIVPVKTRKTLLKEDEEPSRVQFEKISKLPEIFKKDGTITAANASKINDGAAFCLLADGEALKTYRLKPLARVLSYCGFAQDPHWFTTAPIEAIKKVLKQAGLKSEDIDLFEINEAFSSVAMAAVREIPIPQDKLNIHGGAVALGHPIGASGARILTTLVHALHTHNKKTGLASICIGGGEALSMIIKRV